MDTPKAFASIGITYLEQAILAVMGDERLGKAAISKRLSIPKYGDYGWNYAIVRGILDKLTEENRLDYIEGSGWKRIDLAQS